MNKLNEEKVEIRVDTALTALNFLQEVYLWLDKDARYSRPSAKCNHLQQALLKIRRELRKDIDESFIKEKVNT